VNKETGVKDHVMGDPLVGAIVMPEFGVMIPAHVMNDNLYVDIHAMAQSPHDGTPPTAHMVLTEKNVHDLRDYLSDRKLQLNFFEPNDFVTTEVDYVEMPESPAFTRSWVVDSLVLKQIATVKNVSVNNGRVYIPPEELAKYRFMSTMRVRKDADVVMITGDYCLEGKTTKMSLYTQQKLLCLRFQSLLTSSISNEIVKSMYSNLLPVSGRKSVDVTRTGGSNGKVNSQSHKNFLYVFRTNHALAPKRAGACLIIPCDKHYIVVYRKRNPKEGETTMAITPYAPPQPGGAFSLHGNAWTIIQSFQNLHM
jgi:hypothetical protein